MVGFVQVRVSAVLTNAPYILNLDCDHYVNNSKAVREAMCFLMDPQVGRDLCYVQFPQRFDGIDRSDRYANRNTVFFDVSLKLAYPLHFFFNIFLIMTYILKKLKYYFFFKYIRNSSVTKDFIKFSLLICLGVLVIRSNYKKK